MASGRADALTGHTIACQDRDFPEWHGGVDRALAWAVVLDDPDLATLVATGRARLGHLLLPRYERQPHVTLHYSGLADDSANSRVARELELLRQMLPGTLVLEVDDWGTFPMVPHLQLRCQWLTSANRALTLDAPSEHRMTYVPHVTIGHYAGEWPLSTPLAELTSVPLTGADNWTADELSLVSFITSDIAGPLRVEGTLNLTTGEWFT